MMSVIALLTAVELSIILGNEWYQVGALTAGIPLSARSCAGQTGLAIDLYGLRSDTIWARIVSLAATA
jgi:hypothetical protein